MKKSLYPSTVGVPKLALIGVSGAGKSSLALKLLPKSIRLAAAKIAGKSSAQTTLIPTQFCLKEDLSESLPQLRVTLRSFQKEVPQVEEEAVFNAVQHNITSFSKGQKGGISLSSLNNYIENGKYAHDLCTNVNGAVRLDHFRENNDFYDIVRTCAKSLLDDFDTSEIDSAVSKIKGEAERDQTKIIALRDQLRQRWDKERKKSDSAVCLLLGHISQAVWDEFDRLISRPVPPAVSATYTFDMDEEDDRNAFAELLDPYSPLSLIVERYDIACGFDRRFMELYEDKHNSSIWPDPQLPFRLVLTDTVGLTQDALESDDDIAKRLKAALNSGCQGILLMIPVSLRDEKKRSIQRLLSMATEEGRQIRRNEIPIFLGLARADEEVTPQVDPEDDEDYAQEMADIWSHLSEIKNTWGAQFHAQSTRYLTNQPYKITTYVDILDKIDSSLAERFSNALGRESAMDYLFDITATLQKKLFPSEKPIFFKPIKDRSDGLYIKLHVVNPKVIKEMAMALAVSSSKYRVDQWLYWSTAYAFRDSVYTGQKFTSRAIQNGRISIYLDGDVRNAAEIPTWVFPAFTPDQVDLCDIDLEAHLSAPLYRALGLDPEIANEVDVKHGLRKLFSENFIKNSFRFWRALDKTIRRVSFTDADIKAGATRAFEHGRFTEDASNGVDEMLGFYRSLYQNPDFAHTIERIFNEELSEAFNSFFFPLN